MVPDTYSPAIAEKRCACISKTLPPRAYAEFGSDHPPTNAFMSMNKTTIAIGLWCTIIASFDSGDAFAQRRLFLIDDFNSGIQNRLGGYRNSYQKAPSFADAMRVPQARYGVQGLGLRLIADREESGFCGFWIHFFDMRAQNRRYLDASEYHFLSFWVKGAEGGETFSVRLADDRWIAKEDSVDFGDIEKFLPGGVTAKWQEALIPLDNDHGLRLDRLGGMTFEFVNPGQSTVFIDNIAVKSSRSGTVYDTGETDRAAVDSESRELARAIWLWSTESMLDDVAKADAFLRFCKAQGINQVWAQLPFDIKLERVRDQISNSTCIIRRQESLRRFLRSAHAVGLQIHALEGYPEHALRQNHHIPRAIVDAVLAFNKDQPKAEQFDGIHFDNEPYLLLGWHDPQQRKQILFEFLTLNSECQRRVCATSPRIEFGVDIPFWLQDMDVSIGEPHGEVWFGGQRQPASFHLLEMVDNVGVMNYRDQAQGADGMIAHARDLLVHADNSTRTKVFMGVETYGAEPTQVLFAVGRPRSQFEQALRNDASDLAMLSRLDGNRLRVFDDGEKVHVGIEVEETDMVAKRIEIARTISRIAAAFGADSNDPASDSATQSALAKRLDRSGEWSNAKPGSVRDPDSGQRHLLVTAYAIMPEKITFANENASHFAVQTQAAEVRFAQHPSYTGLAIHHYDSLIELLNPDRKADNKTNKRPKSVPANSKPPANLGNAERLTSAK